MFLLHGVELSKDKRIHSEQDEADKAGNKGIGIGSAVVNLTTRIDEQDVVMTWGKL